MNTDLSNRARRAPALARLAIVAALAMLGAATATAQTVGGAAGAAAGAEPDAQPGTAAGTTASDEFTYRTRAGDTLIGLSARLLREPRRWRELQTRNDIREPRRMPLGRPLRIPYDWLRISPQTARVLERVGGVTLDGRDLPAGTTIAAGASLETAADGSVTLELADGSTLVLKPASRLRIEQLRRIEGAGADEAVLQLDQGRLETRVAPRGSMGRFEIRTPAAVSAVRGTEFRASFAPATDSGTTETLDGAVAVSGAGAGVAVPAGFGTRADRGSPPRDPVPLLPAPALAGVPPMNERGELRWTFAPVSGAARYRHQLARDAGFRALVADVVTAEPSSGIDDLADGGYWLRVRAIEASGIEGYDATAPIEQRRRLDAPTALAPARDSKQVGAATRFEWAALPGIGGYRFQLAADAAFTAPLEDRTLDAAATGATTERAGTLVERLAAGRYWWRVAAVEASGSAGHWGEPQAFEQKPAPVVVEPAAAAAAHAFRWDVTEPGQRFEWQIARDPEFRRITRSGDSATPELALEGLQPGRHFVRVRAIDADGFVAPYGPAHRFEVPWPRWVRFALPAIMLIPVL